MKHQNVLLKNSPPRMYASALILLILLCVTPLGCKKETQDEDAMLESSTLSSSPQPMSVVFLPDFSGSGAEHHIPQPNLREIVEQPIEYLRSNGGQVAVGIIDGASDMTLCSCRVDPTSWPKHPVEPRRESFSNDVTFRLASKEYTEKTLKAYSAKLVSIERTVEDRINEFLQCLDAMEERASDTNSTDVFPALNRARVAHAQAPSSCVAFHTVIIGDGEGNREGSLSVADSTRTVSTWCAYCTDEGTKTAWARLLNPHVTTDLQSTLDLIYHQ